MKSFTSPTTASDNPRHPQAQTETNSKCTIPFWPPSQPETTRNSENHHTNIKAIP